MCGVDGDLTQLAPFVDRQRTRLTRGAGHHKPVRTRVNLVLDEGSKIVVVYCPTTEGRDQRRIGAAQEMRSEGDHDRPTSARFVSKPACAPSTTTGSFSCSCHSSDSMAMLSG